MTFKDIASRMTARGVPVVPVPPNSKATHLKGWPSLATTDAAQIEQWNSENQNYNAACVAKPQGFWFLDADEPELAERIEQETGKEFPETFTVESREGRRHYYFRQTESSRAMGNVPKTALKEPLFDAQVSNKYVVAAGSIHPDTEKPYCVVNDAEIVPAPEWLLDWIKGQRKDGSGNSNDKQSKAKVKVYNQGERNDGLTSEAGRLWWAGVSFEELLTILLRMNRELCNPPLPDADVERIARSVSKYDNAPKQTAFPLTELGNAERLVEKFGDDIRYDHQQKMWYVWDERQWTSDDTGLMKKLMTTVVRDTLREAAAIEDKDMRGALIKWEKRSEAEHVIRASIALAQSSVPILMSEFDKNLYLLSLNNGVLDLQTGDFREHRREDKITKRIPGFRKSKAA